MIRTGTRFDMRGNHPRRYASTATPMQARQDSWPFGPRFDFGISISGVDVTVYPGLFYRGGFGFETIETEVTLTADYTDIILKVTPGATPLLGAIAVERYEGAAAIPGDYDGFIVRRLHSFTYVSGTPPRVTWLRSGPFIDLGMFGH